MFYSTNQSHESLLMHHSANQSHCGLYKDFDHSSNRVLATKCFMYTLKIV